MTASMDSMDSTDAAATTEATAPEARAGRVVLVGRSNVGKSTLLNRLVGQKLAIATPTPQTTRTRILGVLESPELGLQIAFVDTPGLHRPRNALGRTLIDEAQAALDGADAVVLVADASARDAPYQQDQDALAAVRDIGRPAVLALNKADLVGRKDLLLPAIERWAALHEFDAIASVSALTGQGIDALVREVGKRLPAGTLYEPGYLTDKPERFFVAELVRESVIAKTRQEVPYGVAVLIEEYDVGAAMTRISAVVVVEKTAHRKILIGAGGARIKQIGIDARREIEAMLGRKVFLGLWVKVVDGWTSDSARVRALALGTDA